jgi:transposase InsO family protein
MAQAEDGPGSGYRKVRADIHPDRLERQVLTVPADFWSDSPELHAPGAQLNAVLSSVDTPSLDLMLTERPAPAAPDILPHAVSLQPSQDAAPSTTIDSSQSEDGVFLRVTSKISELMLESQALAITSVSDPGAQAPTAQSIKANGIYVPLRLNGTKVLALLDSGATTSFLSPSVCKAGGIPYTSSPGRIALAGAGAFATRLGKALGVPVRTPKVDFLHTFEVMELGGSINCIVGMDLLTRLGITIANVPTAFHPGDAAPLTTPSPPASEQLNTTPELDAYSVEFYTFIRDQLQVNSAIQPGTFCSMPESVVYLDTGDHQGFFKRQYPIPHMQQPAVSAQVEEWLRERIIMRAPAPCKWNSPLISVPKKDADGKITKVRVVIDPRPINELIPSVNYPIPIPKDVLESLAGSTVFSTIDLKMSFNQLRVHEPHREVTAFTWAGTQYVFKGCPFGLKPIAAIMQRTMDKLFAGVRSFVVIYVDDIIIHSRTVAEHKLHVRKALELLNSANLKARAEKSCFLQASVVVLGHVVSPAGIRMDMRKLFDVPHFTTPTTGKQISQDLGFFNYFREFIPNYSELLHPIEALRNQTELTSKWTKAHTAIYRTVREVLASGMTLSFPNFQVPFQVSTDASDNGVGAVLYQEEGEKTDGSEPSIKYIAFASSALTDAQRNYGATKKELLAIVFALKRFRYYLWGKHFTLYTDHRALTYLFTVKHSSAMMNSWVEILMDFNFEIVHKPGILNVVPDYLSRLYPTQAQRSSGMVEEVVMLAHSRYPVDDPANNWKLNERIFLKLNQLWGPHTVDTFATSVNTQLTTYFTFELDAFKQNWSGHNCWCNPPWPLISAVIDKVIQDQAVITLVTPYWPDKKWFRLLKHLSIAQPVFLPHTHDLFLPVRTGHTRGIGKPNWGSTAAWRISGRWLKGLSGSFNTPDMTPINLAEIDFSVGQAMAARGTLATPDSVSSNDLCLAEVPSATDTTTVLSKEQQQQHLQRAHLAGHLGATAMYKALRSRGVNWPGMQQACLTECSACTECQRFTIGKHGYHPVHAIHAKLPWDHIAIDLAGPFAASGPDMHTYILVIVDVCTRFVFLRPLPNKCAESVGSALFKVFCDIGFPKIIQSDNGKEFVNKLTQAICKESHIDHRLITPYHPRANGLAERNVKIAKESIYKLINGREQDWSFYVPQTQYFMNTRIASYHDSTPYSLMYGRAHNEFSNYGQVDMSTASEPELRARLKFLTSVVYPSINTKSATFAEKMNAPADVRLTTTIPNGAYVMAVDELRTSKSQPRYLGPFKVLRRNQGGAYVLEDAAGNFLKRSPEALKQVTRNSEFGTSFVVDEVVEHRGDSRSEREYLVKWQGLDSSMNSWEPAKNFDSPSAINKYWKRQLCAKPRAPRS